MHPDRDRIRRNVISRAERDPRLESDADLRGALEHIRRYPLRSVLYPVCPAPTVRTRDVQWDPTEQLRYVMHEGKRLYWHEGATSKEVARGYAALLAEQHPNSAHAYCDERFRVEPGAVVADLGAAEGIFSLSVIERVRRVHLFECGAQWQKALAATFRPWRDKVVVHACLAGRAGQDGQKAIDDLLHDAEPPTFYKIDVEGAEGDVLHGAEKTLARAPSCRIAVCAYHRESDEADLTAHLSSRGYRVVATRGWVLLHRWPEFGEPYFRRGVLRAER